MRPMKKEPAPLIVVRKSPEEWIGRLGQLLTVLEAMDSDERSAALKYAKARYSSEWPSDSY